MLEAEYILRMVVSCICGVIIGIERKNRAKEAGIRTHCIVACASALMMIVSKYGFFDIVGNDASYDGSRVAAQIVSGIGFLGAGMIFVHKNTITGLTTAAGMWATAGIGMALGAGMYVVGISATIIVIFVQILFHKNNRLTATSKLAILSICDDGEHEFQTRLYRHLESMGVKVLSADVWHDAETERLHYNITIELPPMLNEEKVVINYKGSKITAF